MIDLVLDRSTSVSPIFSSAYVTPHESNTAHSMRRFRAMTDPTDDYESLLRIHLRA